MQAVDLATWTPRTPSVAQAALRKGISPNHLNLTPTRVALAVAGDPLAADGDRRQAARQLVRFDPSREPRGLSSDTILTAAEEAFSLQEHTPPGDKGGRPARGPRGGYVPADISWELTAQVFRWKVNAIHTARTQSFEPPVIREDDLLSDPGCYRKPAAVSWQSRRGSQAGRSVGIWELKMGGVLRGTGRDPAEYGPPLTRWELALLDHEDVARKSAADDAESPTSTAEFWRQVGAEKRARRSRHEEHLARNRERKKMDAVAILERRIADLEAQQEATDERLDDLYEAVVVTPLNRVLVGGLTETGLMQ
jgi:hypothetical protein